jgi:aspartyl-tRNA(Asn)/glutamyl-tRNA(Gln) amidotransferase subunit A
MGVLFRDLEDAPLLAELFATEKSPRSTPFARVAVVNDAFLGDCDPAIVASFNTCIRDLESLGLHPTRIEVGWWADAFEILAPIQAFEAAHLHAGHFSHFEASIRQRLQWGASLETAEIAAFRQRHRAFQARMDELFIDHELVLLPATPLTRLDAGADHTQTRSRILRYTAPFSLAGAPVVTIPCAAGGMQLAAANGHDESLLDLAAQLGALRKSTLNRPLA